MAKMADKIGFSSKHLQINSANKSIIIAVSVAVGIVIFSAIATQALVKQMSYQNKVIGLRSKAKDILKKDLAARSVLVASYETFDNAPESIIGTKDKNSKIILDALPSKYDFPALATSLEGLVKSSGLEIGSLTGSDSEATAVQESTDPKPIDIGFSLSGSGSINAAQALFMNMEKSIRPIKVNTVNIAAGAKNNLTVTVTAKTFYQPSKILEIKDEIVKNSNAKKTNTTTQSKVTK